jgi:hypothetical protein
LHARQRFRTAAAGADFYRSVSAEKNLVLEF